MPVDWNDIKEKIGIRATAADFIPSNGTVGLGSGSTSAYFIKELGKRETSTLLCIPTSSSSRALAEASSLPIVISEEEWGQSLDITCDGADYIDIETGIAVKGLGGALVREKIVAQSSKRLLLMVDERKIIPSHNPIVITIPVEITRFGAYKTEELIQSKLVAHYKSTTLRRINKETGQFFITDNGNYTVDVSIHAASRELIEIDKILMSIAGVVETGIFLSYTTDILVGRHDGSLEHYIVT